MIYVASPYSHDDPKVRADRFLAVCKFAARAIEKGFFVIPPVTFTHPIHLAGKLPGNWKFCKDYDTHFIKMCDEFWVLCLKGWDESVGVGAEINIAESLGIKIRYIYFDDPLTFNKP